MRVWILLIILDNVDVSSCTFNKYIKIIDIGLICCECITSRKKKKGLLLIIHLSDMLLLCAFSKYIKVIDIVFLSETL